MGAVDYIFGGMDVVFYQSKLQMNISDASNDACYITAAQQSSGRGYLMYECTISSAEPGIESASTYRAKPGYFGRPWLANTSEVVFYNTTIETSNGMYEYGTVEISGINNGPQRANWSTQLSTPILNDGTPITPFNFTKGNDNWDPFPVLIANDMLGLDSVDSKGISVYSYLSTLYLTNITSKTRVSIYAFDGRLIQTLEITDDTKVFLKPGLWIVKTKNERTEKAIKIITN